MMRKLRKNEILVLRANSKDNTSYKGFVYPSSGIVTAPDWDNQPECGGGLHGLPRGCGDGCLLEWEDGKLAMLLIVDTSSNYFEFEQKCKFSSGEVVFTGTMFDVVTILQKHYPDAPIVYARKQGGYRSTLTGGYRSTLTGGDRSTLTGGDFSTLTGGHSSTLTGGHRSTLTGGYSSTLTGGDFSTLTGGHSSTLTGGDRSTLTGGHSSTLTGGDFSTLTGGDFSTLTGGDFSTLTWKVWDGNYYRLHTFYVGENGINPNTPYKFEDGEISEVEND